jgi:hypothetical protein
MATVPGFDMPDADQNAVLDVFLRGARTYVQGTQLIARLADRLGKNDAVLVRAGFSTITDKAVTAVEAGSTGPDQAVLGQVIFRSDDREHGFALIEGQREAPRRDLDMGIRFVPAERTGRLAGAYSYDGAVDLESTLNVIVQSTKALHETLGDSVSDVWFTGIRGFPLPTGEPAGARSGMVSIQGLRVMRSGATYQSMLKVSLRDAAQQEFCAGHVTFAFKSEEVVDVD